VRDAVEITVEHLARHTSGLPRSPQRLGLRSIWAAGARGEDPYASINTPVLLEQLSRTRLRKAPGKGRIRYSNFGAAVLGVALTQVYGKATYHETIEDVVLQPLGLTAITAEGKTEAEGHAFRRRPAPNWHLDGLAGAGALRSTARDLLSYLRAQLQPDQTPLAEAIRLTHVLLKPAARVTIGLGWMRSLSRAGPMFWHNGGTGGFRSFVGFLPDHGVAAVVLVNDQRSPDRAAIRLLVGELRVAALGADRARWLCRPRALVGILRAQLLDTNEPLLAGVAAGWPIADPDNRKRSKRAGQRHHRAEDR
jgi:D-alanyl-D-alanine-carboxypeptidase/D-alanyl-D-alanine-endopeptidase